VCGRYKLTRLDKAFLSKEFGLREEDIPDYADELDNAPGSWRSVIDLQNGERKWSVMKWGFIATIEGKSKHVFNAKVENLTKLAMWKQRLHKRCIIPASSFFEWKKINGKPGPKYEITVRDQPVFGFAALYDDTINPKTGERERVFWIITTPPNPIYAEYHNRQPAILDRSQYDEWLGQSARPPLHLLRVFREDRMVITKVADAKRKTKPERKPADDEPRLPGLFDY
jgi:putative SOS response-associated peptidase YedK